MKIKVDLKIFLILIVYLLTRKIEILALSFIFIFIHELSHLTVGIVLGLKIKKVSINIAGLSIEFENYGEERKLNRILIDIAGPLVNLGIFIVAIILKAENIAYINFLIFIINIIPIYPLDGGRIVKNIMLYTHTYKETMIKIEKISKGNLIILTFVSSLLILYIKNIALFIFIIYLWYLVLKEDKKNRIIQRVFKTIENNR